ncbi:MAG: AarF/UbiB family protein [Bdellovibrionota bacterium]
MPTRKTKKNSSAIRKKRIQNSLLEMSSHDYNFVAPLAKEIRSHSNVLAKYISFVIAEIAMNPFSNQTPHFSRFDLLKSLTRILFPNSDFTVSQIEKSIQTLQETLGEFSIDVLKKTEVTTELIAPLIEVACSALEANPQLIALFWQPIILEEVLGSVGERISSLLNLIPALSTHAAERFPDLKETFFHALFLLSKEERTQLYKLAEEIMGEVYRVKVFPMLKKTLSSDPRGKVLAPILAGAIEAIPGESCINALLAMACTPHNEFSNGRVIAIAIQEIGGLYIKIAQVIAELCPPSLARELRTTQDDAGGIFPSIEQSWEYFLNTINEPIYNDFRIYMKIPEKPMRHYASASIGSLYNIELNEEGREKFKVNSILIKLQRPNLKEMFAKQCEHILKLTDEAQKELVEDSSLSSDAAAELLGLVSTLRRAILNYHKQSQEELDFTFEQTNAQNVRDALGDNNIIKIPRFFFASEKSVFMECINGLKVTRIIQTKYLERREIADSVARAYVDLVFNKGVVWADPHPGNILYNYEDAQISMIDLNPCYVWDTKTREEFKHLIYRLILRDADGVYRTLYHLVENQESLRCNSIIDDLNSFLTSAYSSSSLTRFVGEFIKTLSENQIDLKVEVQAALRGLSQIALTTASISVRNSFGSILRSQFRFKDLLGTVWNVGLFRVSKVFFSVLFEFIRQMPEEDIGPVLDERDVTAILERTRELAKANVCNVSLRRVSPEDHPNLKMSQDGQVLLVTSDLYMEIIDKIRPARVRYVIEIPARKWLKDRQEFIKLASIARSFCTIECLEQLRRNSLDDYWKIVEAWGKQIQFRTLEETELIAEVNIAARHLYSLRFRDIWKSKFSTLTLSTQLAWKWLMILEVWREKAKQNYLISLKKQDSDISLPYVLYGSYCRFKILMLEGLLWFVKKSVKNLRFSMHLLPMSSMQLEDLVLFGLSRNFNHSFRSQL